MHPARGSPTAHDFSPSRRHECRLRLSQRLAVGRDDRGPASAHEDGDGVRVLHRRRVLPPHRRVASHKRTDMVLDALEMARRSCGGRRFVGLVPHADAGSQFTSVRFTERLDEIGARPSIGTVADCLTMPPLRRPTGCSRPSAYEGRMRQRCGPTSTSSSSRHCRGCTGSTRIASTATAAMFHQQSSSQRSTLPNRPTPPGLETNSPSLQRSQGGSHSSFARGRLVALDQ